MAKMKSIGTMSARLKAFPRELKRITIVGGRNHCYSVRNTIIDGIRKNNLVNPRLNEITTYLKKLDGKPRVQTPLMGKGDSDKESMINGLVVKQTNSGWRLTVEGKHYSGKPQKMIWAVQEFGALIPVSPGFRKFLSAHGFHVKKKFFKIPARFPFKKGKDRYYRSRLRKSNDMKLNQYLKALLEQDKSTMSARIKELEELHAEANS
jgi:hypothetical protein